MNKLDEYNESKKPFAELHAKYVELGSKLHILQSEVWLEALQQNFPNVAVEQVKILGEITGKDDVDKVLAPAIQRIKQSGVSPSKILLDEITRKIILLY